MSCCSSGGCCPPCNTCKTFKTAVAVILSLTTLFAIAGVFVTHFKSGGMSFGTTEGSVALLTLVVSSVVWLKMVRKMCPCRTACCKKEGGKCSCGVCEECKKPAN